MKWAEEAVIRCMQRQFIEKFSGVQYTEVGKASTLEAFTY
jgi:hypothetical protein